LHARLARESPIDTSWTSAAAGLRDGSAVAATALSYVAATASPEAPGQRPHAVSETPRPSQRPRLPMTLYPVIKGVSYDADGDPLVTREHANGTLAASPLSPAAPVDELVREALLLYRSN
jgi:hypothetical protein